MKRDERQSLIMIWFNYGLNWNKYVDPWLNIGMLCMQELFFGGWVDYLKHCELCLTSYKRKEEC